MKNDFFTYKLLTRFLHVLNVNSWETHVPMVAEWDHLVVSSSPLYFYGLAFST